MSTPTQDEEQKPPTPEALRRYTLEELEFLAQDLRHRIIDVSLRNGGHLGASLGTVEIAIALHREFRSPDEPLFWDVGHQAYAHKLLTGRWDEFATLRTAGGISGFLSRGESPHDVWGAGHSSTSLSAAIAAAWARRESANTDPLWTVAVIGDGGLTAGVAYEAMNQWRSQPLGPLLVVLNDNQMSIAPNVGAIASILGEGKAGTFFELFGAEYLGPIDGHDLSALIEQIQAARRTWNGKPIVLHCLTQKGRGYAPAEARPAFYHGIGPLQASGKVAGAQSPQTPVMTWSEAAGAALCLLASENASLVAISAAMPEGTGLTEFASQYPERFFDVGIAEPHAVTFAAGLAAQGALPVVAIYSTFLQRAEDAIIHDVALQGLPVIFAIDRAGAVGADGPTHHGAFDLALLLPVPGLTVAAPACRQDVETLFREALERGAPTSIRYPRGAAPDDTDHPLENGVRVYQESANPRAILVGLGPEAATLAKLAKQLGKGGEALTVLGSVYAKPLPAKLLEQLDRHPAAAIITLEAGTAIGGFGAHLATRLSANGRRVHVWGYPDRFLPQGTVAEILAGAGLDLPALALRLREVLQTG